MQRSLLMGGVILACLLTATAALVPTSAADKKRDDPQEKSEQPTAGARLMRAKLASSNLILEGMVVEDFKAIEEGALRLQVVSALDEWRVSDDEVYTQYSKEFRRIVGTMKTQAQKKNLDGVALGYVEMTMSCVRCHKFLRDEIPDKQRQPR